MRFYWLILSVLAVWRLTHLIQAEDGPWNLTVRLRSRIGPGFWGSLLDCFNCLSLWIAVAPACLLGEGVLEKIFLWFALSGGAILLQRFTEQQVDIPSAVYYEETENDGGMLRREKK